MESLARHMGSVSDSVGRSAQRAQRASDISREVRQGLLQSNEKMQNVTEVIQNISDKSADIRKIVKTIDDIAFQTNILAQCGSGGGPGRGGRKRFRGGG